MKEKDGILYNPLSTPPCKKNARPRYTCYTALIFRKAKPAGVEQLSLSFIWSGLCHLRPWLSIKRSSSNAGNSMDWQTQSHGSTIGYRFYRLVVRKTEHLGKHKVIIIAYNCCLNKHHWDFVWIGRDELILDFWGHYTWSPKMSCQDQGMRGRLAFKVKVRGGSKCYWYSWSNKATVITCYHH